MMTGGDGDSRVGRPATLPVPEDDGAAAHLPGMRLPATRLHAPVGWVDFNRLPSRTALFVFPSIGIAADRLEKWATIPGAPGCEAEVCDFRDEFSGFRGRQLDVVGLSSQPVRELRLASERLHLPYPLASDPEFAFADALDLPTFEFDGSRYYKRLTLIVSLDSRIEGVLYPVFPPDQAARRTLDWLRRDP